MLKKVFQKLANMLGYEVYKMHPKGTDAGNFVNVDLDKFHVLPKADVTYAYDLLYTQHNCDFMTDPKFIESYNLGKATDVNQTVLKNYDIYWRIHVLCWAANYAKNLPGDFVDCGVNTGIFSRAVINYINFNATGKTYYLLDTFSGLDPTYSSEAEMAQELNQKYTKYKDTLYDQVKDTFKNFNVNIIKGAVPETLTQVKAQQVAYLSVDMNCVQPEADTLNYFWDKMAPGGIIILDDYGNVTNEQKKAHDEFARSKGVEVLSLPTCQGIIIKPVNL
ncbi:hypothetical protein CJD36_012325 [Flavipsychrobacter stenotrophus]|uniref:Methyltransferase n=1 Tax=Flavipsychrobacter stenotrophus TaxID=2077091 RepID=A0A2S7SV08_9BACT|nr:TylF/MycF/NovP-related O-methyltransferase [Flavipsychrobacter stenotrophus]PQJ10750.1 hypothetical protein CJD36_012325 [Flavipsychrobacter stenotrophus]